MHIYKPLFESDRELQVVARVTSGAQPPPISGSLQYVCVVPVTLAYCLDLQLFSKLGQFPHWIK